MCVMSFFFQHSVTDSGDAVPDPSVARSGPASGRQEEAGEERGGSGQRRLVRIRYHWRIFFQDRFPLLVLCFRGIFAHRKKILINYEPGINMQRNEMSIHKENKKGCVLSPEGKLEDKQPKPESCVE